MYGVFYFAVISEVYTVKRFTRRFISYILLTATLAGLVTVGGFSVSALSPTVVTTDAVRLRSSAGFDSDNIITVLDLCNA